MSYLNHSFSVELAKEYGVECAILINHFQFWIEQNKSMKRNFYDGKTWMYQSQKEIAAIYPYWSEDSINRLIKKLIDEGVLIKGNFNKNSFDRTVWYAFKDEKKFIIPRNRGMEDAKSRNPKREVAEPIPYIIPNRKHDVVVVVGEEPPPKGVGNVHNSGKAINKDDIYHYSLAAKKDWTPIEIEYAWKAFRDTKADVSDVYAYIDGTINKKRILEQNRQFKEKQSQKEKSCKKTYAHNHNNPNSKKESKNINLKPMDRAMLEQALAELLGP